MSGRFLSFDFLDAIEQLVDTALSDADVRVVGSAALIHDDVVAPGLTFHGVGLSRACLTVREDSSVVTLSESEISVQHF
jgi:hypothetical protein